MGNHDAVWVFGALLGWTSRLLHTGCPITQSRTELIKSGLRASSQGQPGPWTVVGVLAQVPVSPGPERNTCPSVGETPCDEAQGQRTSHHGPHHSDLGANMQLGLADPAGTHSLATASGAPQGEVPASPSPHTCPGLSLPTPVFQVFKQKPGRLSPQKPH